MSSTPQSDARTIFAEPDPDLLLDVRGLTVAYRDYDRRKVVRIVDDVSFQLRRGEALGLAGESGCGKTTTAFALLGLLRALPGRRPHELIPVQSDPGHGRACWLDEMSAPAG